MDPDAAPMRLDTGKLDEANLSGAGSMGGTTGTDINARDGDDAYLAFNFDFTAVIQLCKLLFGGIGDFYREVVPNGLIGLLLDFCQLFFVMGPSKSRVTSVSRR